LAISEVRAVAEVGSTGDRAESRPARGGQHEEELRCPNCAQAMERRTFERQSAGDVALDLCLSCHALWFDRAESAQLAPRGVLELFQLLHRQRDKERRSLEGRLACPRCKTALVLTQDLGKTGRFSYYRCPNEHGRFTPFFQFLREKQFVRSLNRAELARVRAEVKQVQCSGCGAPIDLERAIACTFCQAPVAILDADAVEKALREWSAEAARQDGERRRAREKAVRLDHAIATRRGDASDLTSQPLRLGADLLAGCIDMVSDMFDALGDE
jgi:Zn-finger nucleic acid-binding protein